jgi:hypothetical protein
LNIQKLPISDIPALSKPYIPVSENEGKRVNLLLLTAPGRKGVINTQQAEHTLSKGGISRVRITTGPLAGQCKDVVVLNRTSSI